MKNHIIYIINDSNDSKFLYSDYIKTMNIMKNLHIHSFDNPLNSFLWFLEYDRVYTSGKSNNDSFIINKSIKNKVFVTDRGGNITIHNKGQIVVYFAINIKKSSIYPIEFVDSLERAAINTLKEFNILGHRSKLNRGVFVNDKKIFSIGIKISKGVVYHGVCLNISNDLSVYDDIVTCGFGFEMTSIFNEIYGNNHESNDKSYDEIKSSMFNLSVDILKDKLICEIFDARNIEYQISEISVLDISKVHY